MFDYDELFIGVVKFLVLKVIMDSMPIKSVQFKTRLVLMRKPCFNLIKYNIMEIYNWLDADEKRVQYQRLALMWKICSILSNIWLL